MGSDGTIITEPVCKLYPNPVNGQLLFSEVLYDFEVYNVFGQIVISKIKSANSISTQQLKDGVYFIRSQKSRMKFIVTH